LIMLDILQKELQEDPTGKGYAALLPDSPGRVADLLNAQTEQMVKSRFITERGIMSRCQNGNEILDALENASANNSAIRRALKFLGQEAGLDIGDKYTQGMIARLPTDGVIDQAWADQLKSLALQPASRAEVLGLPSVTDLHVVKALEIDQ